MMYSREEEGKGGGETNKTKQTSTRGLGSNGYVNVAAAQLSCQKITWTQSSDSRGNLERMLWLNAEQNYENVNENTGRVPSARSS